MNDGLNKVMLIGYVDGTIELRHTSSGRPVTSFTVATSRTLFSAEGEPYNETEWFNIIAWGSLAEKCVQQISDRQNVYLEGRLQTRSWEDDAGTTHFRTEIVVQDVVLLG